MSTLTATSTRRSTAADSTTVRHSRSLTSRTTRGEVLVVEDGDLGDAVNRVDHVDIDSVVYPLCTNFLQSPVIRAVQRRFL